MDKFLIPFGLVVVLIAFAALLGWIMNIVGFLSCDFESPYRCELIRAVGIVFPPVGSVAGYMDLGV